MVHDARHQKDKIIERSKRNDDREEDQCLLIFECGFKMITDIVFVSFRV